MTLLKSFRRANIGVKLSILVAIVQLIGFLGLGIVLSQSASQQLRTQVSQSLDNQQSQVADMVELFDQTLQEEADLLLDLFLDGLAPNFSLAPNQKVLVAGRQTPVLNNGDNVLNGNYDILDRFTNQTGAPITLFARDGNDFVRVTTSVKKSGGERAVGTLLDPASKSYAHLMSGKPYLGFAELFGTPYITKYQPIQDRGGKVIGASFIGIDITEQMAMLKGKIRDMSQGESGYTMLVSASPAQQGQVIAGGSYEGSSLMALETLDGEPAFSALFDSASGKISYALADNDTRQRTTHYLAYPQWDWVIASTVFEDEVNAYIVALRNWAILAAALLALGFSLMLYLCQRALISRPLASLVALAQGLAKGDLSQRVRTTREDEIGQLTTAMNGIGEGLTRIVGQVNASTSSVNHAAEEIAQSSRDMASRTEQSAANLQETSASMEQITSTVQNTAHSAQQASQLVQATVDTAKRGNTAMNQARDTMNDINASAAKIGEIITLIDGIAFQTNILALNASVEAARAGEHGRGFAVVAQEVRTLATRSSDASKEIRALIDESVAFTKTGSELVGSAALTMEEILQGIERVTDMIGEITSGAKEQSDGISQVNIAVTELDTMTQQNAAMVEQSSAAAEELRGQAEQLNGLMATFTLGDHGDNLVTAADKTPKAPRAPALAQKPARTSVATASSSRHEAEWEAF